MKKFLVLLASFAVSSQINFAQTTAQPTPADSPQTEIRREKRAQAYAKLLEGQRLLLDTNRRRKPSELASGVRAAKESLQKAVELDPNLAEAYTTLAELTLSAPPHDLDEALMLANIAVKISADNYGGHRILARLYTIKSKLNRGELNREFAAKAVAEWNEIARLDARSAEAFAFLSEFYAQTNKPEQRIAALRRWVAAAAPLETRFYKSVMGAQAELDFESASVKLGGALLEEGQTAEAIEILSRTIADNPENTSAIELLRDATETSSDVNAAVVAAQALSRAIYAKPDSVLLVSLLAQIEARAGRIDEAAKTLRASSAKLAEKDKPAAAALHVALGDIYAGADRNAEALAAYQTALTARGIGENAPVRDAERDFAIRVFEKMIQTAKKSDVPNEAKNLIARSRTILGKEDFFADRQLIAFYRETGKNSEALQATRALRAGNSDDYGLLRLEASILTDGGRVDEAVKLIKPLIGKKVAAGTTIESGGAAKPDGSGTLAVYSPMFDDFTNYLFISNLYSQAKRGREAVEAAKQAINVGQDEERKQIARLSLATAQQQSGDVQAAELTLRDLLKQTPGNPIALNNLGYFLVERNSNLEEAKGFIERAVKIDPTNPSYLDSLGWAYFKLEKFERAEKLLKDALRYDASSATIHEHLGDVYQKQGKTELARNLWRKSLNLTVDAEQINRLKSKIDGK